MKKYNEMTSAELLAEKCYMEQLGEKGIEALSNIVNILIKRGFDMKPIQAEVKEIIIYVTFELGYRWSIHIEGIEFDCEDMNGMTKAEAIKVARKLKKEIFGSKIKEQKLTRKEKAENISYLHENGYSYL